MSTAIIPAATLALSALTYKLTWLDERSTSSLRPLVETCLTNSAGWFSNGIVSSSFRPALNDILCLRMAFLRQLFSDRTGHASFLVYGSILFPLILRLGYKAASPNSQSPMLGIILPILAFLLTSSSVLLLGTGLGTFIPAIISILYTAGSITNKTSTTAVPLPAATRGVYGTNLAVIASTILFFAQLCSTGDNSDKSLMEYYVSKDFVHAFDIISGIFSDIFPLIVSIPLVALGLKEVQRPKNEIAATKYLKEEYLPAEVAYGFERTWAYYRQTGLLATFGYAYGMSRLIRINVFGGEPLSSAGRYLLLISANLALVQLGIVVTEILTTPKDAIDEEARKAIAKAPAGNPGVDDNLPILAMLALVTGPTLPAMLWYGRGEEVRGWKGRRAWRLASADSKAIKK